MPVSPDDRREYRREWYQKNKDRLKLVERAARIGRDDYWRYRHAALEKLGGKCSRCGFTDSRALQIDHVNGGGKKEILRGWRWIKKIVTDPTGYQLLCANCNWIKRHERGEGNQQKHPD